jgi:adenylosuccinate lyase
LLIRNMNIIVAILVGENLRERMVERKMAEERMERNKYITPLTERYGSTDMRGIFSDSSKYSTWRLLWFTLARAEQQLGLDITDEQLYEMQSHINDIDYDVVEAFERECRHDVMAHLKEYCTKCPTAAPIIHLGATSCYITDNTDILLMRKAMMVIKNKISTLRFALCNFCEKYGDVVTMAYTHLQPAQPTTVGKRGCMWLQDIIMDKESINNIKLNILGCNGATGTQASFLDLFNNEYKTSMLNEILAEKLAGNKDAYMLISGQTYTRKVDAMVLDALSNIAQSLHKMCSDIRLLQGMHEICEPFGSGQVGSSAMAYKQNPIKCENICSLARHIISMTMTAKMNTCTQWLERSLDDSANRRIIIPEAFILTDHILNESIKIIQDLTVNEGMIKRHIKDNIPFILMESFIMNATKQGISRQDAHSRIRDLSVIAMDNMLNGGENNLIDLVRNEELLKDIEIEMDYNKLAGMASTQVKEYLRRLKENEDC